jgi:hypothetical protein
MTIISLIEMFMPTDNCHVIALSKCSVNLFDPLVKVVPIRIRDHVSIILTLFPRNTNAVAELAGEVAEANSPTIGGLSYQLIILMNDYSRTKPSSITDSNSSNYRKLILIAV